MVPRLRRFVTATATATAAAAVLTACADPVVPSATVVEVTPAVSFARTGSLSLTKDCSAYAGRAGDSCTITSSSLDAVEVGSTIVYASGAVGTSLDTDVVLDLPGPGNNRAFGHCTLDLATGIGACTLAGGTGKFTWLQATVAVSHLGGPNFGWVGTYAFTPRN